MSLNKIYLPSQCYFVTTNTVNKKWIFGKFENGVYSVNNELCRIVLDVLNDTRNIFKFLLHGYVIMPDHFHAILTLAENEFSATRAGGDIDVTRSNKNYNTFRVGEDLSSPATNIHTRVGKDLSLPSVNNISQIMKAIKGKSARIINNVLGNSGQLWQHSFYEHGIRNDQDFIEKINYIHINPVRANLVKDPSDYKYSSFRNYYLNDHSIIKIDIIEL
jgi:REP element-mobilizing transposase RayT